MFIGKRWNADIDKRHNEVFRIQKHDEVKGSYVLSFILRSSCAEELLIPACAWVLYFQSCCLQIINCKFVVCK